MNNVITLVGLFLMIHGHVICMDTTLTQKREAAKEKAILFRELQERFEKIQLPFVDHKLLAKIEQERSQEDVIREHPLIMQFRFQRMMEENPEEYGELSKRICLAWYSFELQEREKKAKLSKKAKL